MKHLSICAGLTLALLASCAKKHPADVAAPGGAGADAFVMPTVNDPSVVCRATAGGRTVYSVEIAFPDGCGPLPTTPGGQARDLEITVEGAPPSASVMEPVDLSSRSVGFVANGCAAAITLGGDIGTLKLDVAPIDSGNVAIKGTGHWAPASGGGCNVTLTGQFSDDGPPDAD